MLFAGPVYGEEKSSLFADADVFALPSRYENFANVAAEAIACGVPVIITPFCGIRSLVDGRAGLVVLPEKEALTVALKQMLHDKSLYARLREGCREVTSELSWDRLTEQMEVLLQRCCGREPWFHLNRRYFMTSTRSIGPLSMVRLESNRWCHACLST